MKSSSLGLWLLAIAPFPAVGLDYGEFSAVWLARYHAASLNPAGDEDHDGMLNGDEAMAGTDPYDATSWPATILRLETDTTLAIEITSQPGKAYQVFRSDSPAGPWNSHGPVRIADAGSLRISVPRSGTAGFYRVEISDRDSDGDGLSDWEESQLAGFDSHDRNSFGPGNKNVDFGVASAMLAAIRNEQLSVTSTSPRAYEREHQPAVISVARSSGTEHPFTVFLHLKGPDDPAKSRASSSDFTLVDEVGSPVGDRLVIPAGASASSIQVVPTPDNLIEVPEFIEVGASGSSTSAVVSICDGDPVKTDPRIFVADLNPIFGTGSTGSGHAVVRLSGDHDSATVALDFTNLKSSVSEVRLEGGDESPLLAVPPDAYDAQEWPIRAAGSYPTNQAVLDALLAADISLSVKTAAYPAGEIRGTFIAANGSMEFTPPPNPPPVEPLTGSALDRDIVRFLDQATFGPTMEAVTAMQGLVASHSGDRIAAFDQWIDEQFSLPSPRLLDYNVAADRQEIEVRAGLPPEHPDYHPAFEPLHLNRIRGWWTLAFRAPNQLRQRTAFALSEIFVVSDRDTLVALRAHGTASYYDALLQNASGNYRDLLESVATHPIMGHYLSHLRNEKTIFDESGQPIVSPDENFAREIMQLFSIGLVALHPDGSLRLTPDGLPVGTYSQEDVVEMARVFTGWSFAVVNLPRDSATVVTNSNFYHDNGLMRHEAQWIHPMAMFPEHHDTEAKTVLGLELPSGQSGEQDLAAILDHLASHPNTAPFICRQLIQRLVTANPSAGYLYRVSNAFSASGGDIPRTIKAILLDPEARSPSSALSGIGSGKKREPMLRGLAFMRAFGAHSDLRLSDLGYHGYPASEIAKFPANTTQTRLVGSDYWFSQTPQSAPTVFNWFRPDHVPAGILAANGLASPELQLANENSVFQEINFGYYLINLAYYAPPLPGQELPPYGYPPGANHIKLDLAPLERCYLDVVDTNGDGQFTSLDSGTFNHSASIASACESVVDRIDFLLCAGALKDQYGSDPSLPRQIIIDTVRSVRSGQNGVDLPESQAAYMRDRIKSALWLVASSPDAVIQK